ncbi:MAG TPA: hypothetical protein VFX12_11225 [Vicinamibacterales bacterium]|nr:hypothetical protein [Vicinamibacterales bacterium]
MTDPAADAIAALVHRRVSVEEVRAALEDDLTSGEREHVEVLVRWFTRRYPTGAERLAYVRRAYRRWTAQRPDLPR